MFAKKNNISFKESAVLLTLLGLILLLPLLVLQLFGQAWGEVSWQDTTDIAMIEWTGAFFHVFLFLLLIEQYKASKRLMFVFIACGFLCMGLMNFFYALSSPGTETAMWIRSFSLLLGGICFSFSIPARNSQSFSDIPGVIIKFIIPTVLLAALGIWIATSLNQILPHLLTSKGSTSLFGRIFLIIPGAFFFFTALVWLHQYIKDKRRVDFLFTIVILIFAQMTLLVRGASTWGIIWWLLHVVILVDVLTACVYMLVLSFYRSLVWKLIFSLGLAFSLTVLVASGIIQSFSQKQFMKNFQVNLHEKHRRTLLESESNFNFALYALDTLISDARELSENEKKQGEFYSQLRQYMERKSIAWSPFFIEFGFCPENGNILSYFQHGLKNKRTDFDTLVKFRNEAIEEGTNSFEWSSFYYDSYRGAWVSTLIAPFKKDNINGIFFVTIDVSQIRNPNILRAKDISKHGGCVVFDRNTGEVICDFLPDSYQLDQVETETTKLKDEPLLRKLVAAAIDITPDGRIMLVNMRGNKYYISAHLLRSVDWGVLNIVDFDNFPVEKGSSRYFFIAVGMLTLLWGFVLLLLLLHRQVSRPLNKLLTATQQLEEGDFAINIDIRDGTELGAISKAFNHMAWKMKDVYSDLEDTIQQRTTALEEVKKTDNAKVTFFQNISHELRTPMHGILSFARLGVKLNLQKNPEKVYKYFNNINTSAERLMKMIDSIMDLAKLESGHMTFYFQPSSFILPLHQIDEELKAAFMEKQIELILNVPVENITASIDVDMMCRVYRNLLGNALKMSDPETKIEVIIENKEDMVQVSILDEGPGIPENEINRIFDKFVQAGEGKKRGGTGLGLAVCREVVLAHHGRIWAENRKGKGACFSFEMPLNIKEGKKKSETSPETKNTDS